MIGAADRLARSVPRLVALTAVALLAFAGNSLLCRLALGHALIDAASFATVRTVSGALLLGLLAAMTARPRGRIAFDWRTVIALAAYMVCFSFAYLSLQAGTGALLLFGAVQVTMFAAALRAGERLSAWSWAGMALAVAGLCYLVAPGVTAPEPAGAALMVVAGVAWGLYSLHGRGNTNPLLATATNFAGSIPIVLMVSVLAMRSFHGSPAGLLLAVASGAVTSGLGYVAWYAALPRLSAMRAATLQLSVPVIAAFGGVAVLAEPVTFRLVVASVATIGGIAIFVTRRSASR